MGNVDHQTGGWCLTMDGSGGNRISMRIVGTSGGDDLNRNFTKLQTHLVTFTYNGSIRLGRVDGQTSTMNDTGTIPNNPNADFVLGGCGRDYGTPSAASKVRISEVLIYKEDLSAVDVSKLEGYLAHKWNLTNRLVSGHAYASVHLHLMTHWQEWI